MELTQVDIDAIGEMFGHLDNLATVYGVHEVEIRFRTDGYDWITIGYGESGEPAVIKVETDPPPKVEPSKLFPMTTINKTPIDYKLGEGHWIDD